MTRIPASKSFGEMHVFGVRVTHRVEPALIVETDGIDHKRLALPFTRGIAHPSRFGILHRLTAVEEYLTENVVLLVKDQDQSRCLNNFVRERYGVKARQAARLAMRYRRVCAPILKPLHEQRSRRRLERHFILL